MEPGPAIDAVGNPVYDPSKNVDALVEAAAKRLDDLRIMEAENLRRDINHIREVVNLEREHNKEMREQDREHSKELRELETKRLDAVRLVDVQAVQTAAGAAEARAATLGKQVADAAEARRAADETQRLTAQANLQATVEPLANRLAVLEQAGWATVGGKAQVVESREQRGETRLNYGAIYGGIALLISLVGLIVLIVR